MKRRPALLGIGAKETPDVDGDLGVWGKGAAGPTRGKRKVEQVYNPVLLRDKETGEMLTEEEVKARQEEANNDRAGEGAVGKSSAPLRGAAGGAGKTETTRTGRTSASGIVDAGKEATEEGGARRSATALQPSSDEAHRPTREAASTTSTGGGTSTAGKRPSDRHRHGGRRAPKRTTRPSTTTTASTTTTTTAAAKERTTAPAAESPTSTTHTPRRPEPLTRNGEEGGEREGVEK